MGTSPVPAVSSALALEAGIQSAAVDAGQAHGVSQPRSGAGNSIDSVTKRSPYISEYLIFLSKDLPEKLDR